MMVVMGLVVLLGLRVWWFCVPAHVESEELYIQTVEKFGENLVARDQVQVGSAFLQFSVFTKELMALFKNLVRVEKVWVFSA